MVFLLAVLLLSGISQAQQTVFWDSPAPARQIPVLFAQEKVQENLLLDTAKKVGAQFKEDAQGSEKLFHANFLKQVPAEQIQEIFQKYYSLYGKVNSVAVLEKKSEYNGQFSLSFANGTKLKITLAIDRKNPHLITGLFLHNPILPLKDLEAAVAEFKKLPGTVSFQLVRLGDKGEILAQLNPNKELAIGSTFKLYILGALSQEKKDWNSIVKLKKEYMSFPSGDLHTWPVGSPLTVHTLASKMISESDNTATDHLLHYVGRETVEKHLKAMGHQNPPRTMPFLSTLEMFKLKSDDELMASYEKADMEGKRKLLAGAVAAMPREKVDTHSEPTAIETLEWFASASDLVRLMDFLRLQNDEAVLKIMAINPGLDIPKDTFEYAGYKGGSEPGVLNLTWLLKSKKGASYALTASWSNPKENLEQDKLTGLLQSIIYLIEPN